MEMFPFSRKAISLFLMAPGLDTHTQEAIIHNV